MTSISDLTFPGCDAALGPGAASGANAAGGGAPPAAPETLDSIARPAACPAPLILGTVQGSTGLPGSGDSLAVLGRIVALLASVLGQISGLLGSMFGAQQANAPAPPEQPGRRFLQALF